MDSKARRLKQELKICMSDDAKKINRHKRFILMDTLRLVLKVYVAPVNLKETDYV